MYKTANLILFVIFTYNGIIFDNESLVIFTNRL